MKIGVLGGGQLGRMLAMSGIELGHSFVFLDPKNDACAAEYGTHIVGELTDTEKLTELTEQVDVVTYESENLPLESAKFVLERVQLHPSMTALEVTQDRLKEKRLSRDLGIPTAEFLPVESAEELGSAIERIGFPAILKTRRMGYDGKGQIVLRTFEDIPEAETLCSTQCILEKMVTFQRELSIVVSRSSDGTTVYYPLTENVHRDSILHTSVAPAVVDSELEDKARSLADKLLSHFDYVGTMAVELFCMEDGELLLNEIAPRVHNSGHWTIEGAETSQFENHIRAITGMRLGSVALNGHSTMVNIVATCPDTSVCEAMEGVHVHLYGKAERPKRKIGHITVCHEDAEYVRDAMEQIEKVMLTYRSSSGDS